MTGKIPSQRASNAESVSKPWHHHILSQIFHWHWGNHVILVFQQKFIKDRNSNHKNHIVYQLKLSDIEFDRIIFLVVTHRISHTMKMTKIAKKYQIFAWELFPIVLPMAFRDWDEAIGNTRISPAKECAKNIKMNLTGAAAQTFFDFFCWAILSYFVKIFSELWLFTVCEFQFWYMLYVQFGRLSYMMTSSNGNISALLAFCAGNSPVTGG